MADEKTDPKSFISFLESIPVDDSWWYYDIECPKCGHNRASWIDDEGGNVITVQCEKCGEQFNYDSTEQSYIFRLRKWYNLVKAMDYDGSNKTLINIIKSFESEFPEVRKRFE